MNCPGLRRRELHLRIGGESTEIVEKLFEVRPRNANGVFKVIDGKAIQGLIEHIAK